MTLYPSISHSIRAVLNFYSHDGGPSLALGPPSWARASDALEREERRGHRRAVVQELIEELSVGPAGGAGALEDLNETQERGGSSDVVDPKDGHFLCRASDDDALASAHERPGEGRIDGEGTGRRGQGDPAEAVVDATERDLLPADELRRRGQQLLVAVEEVEIDEGREVRAVGSHIQGEQGQQRRPRAGGRRDRRPVERDVGVDHARDRLIMPGPAVEDQGAARAEGDEGVVRQGGIGLDRDGGIPPDRGSRFAE